MFVCARVCVCVCMHMCEVRPGGVAFVSTVNSIHCEVVSSQQHKNLQ